MHQDNDKESNRDRDMDKSRADSSAEEGEVNDEEPTNDDNDPEVIQYKVAIQRVSPALRCTCCGNVYSDPVRLPRCGHMMNRDCVSVKRRHGNVLVCPMCTQRNYINDTDDLVTDFDVAARIPPKPSAWIARINRQAENVFYQGENSAMKLNGSVISGYNSDGEVDNGAVLQDGSLGLDKGGLKAPISRNQKDRSSRKRKRHRHKHHHKRHHRNSKWKQLHPTSPSISDSDASSVGSRDSRSTHSSSTATYSSTHSFPQVTHHIPSYFSETTFSAGVPPPIHHIHPHHPVHHIPAEYSPYTQPPAAPPVLPLHNHPPPSHALQFTRPPPNYIPPTNFPPPSFPLPHIHSSLPPPSFPPPVPIVIPPVTEAPIPDSTQSAPVAAIGKFPEKLTSLEKEQLFQQKNAMSMVSAAAVMRLPTVAPKNIRGALLHSPNVAPSTSSGSPVSVKPMTSVHFDNLGGFLASPAPVLNEKISHSSLVTTTSTLPAYSAASPVDVQAILPPPSSFQTFESKSSEQRNSVDRVPHQQMTVPPNTEQKRVDYRSSQETISEEAFQTWYKRLSSDQTAVYSEAELREMLHDYYKQQQERAAMGESVEDSWRDFFLKRYHSKIHLSENISKQSCFESEHSLNSNRKGLVNGSVKDEFKLLSQKRLMNCSGLRNGEGSIQQKSKYSRDHNHSSKSESSWHHMCIGNLPGHVQANDIYNVIKNYGRVECIRVVCIRDNGYPYNFAMVSMDSPEAIESSMAALNGTTAFDDKHILVTRKAMANIFADTYE